MSDFVPTFTVVGLPDRPDFVPGDDVRRALAAHTVFVGAERHRALVGAHLPAGHRWLPLCGAAALAGTACVLRRPLLVFASGDPLFYGIAAALRRAMPAARVHVLPWFNCLQLLCHRLALPYAELVATSVHGRDWHELDAALLRGDRLVGVLTDAERTPAALAGRLLEHGFTHYTVHIGERLESPAERVRSLAPAAAATAGSDPLNCVVLAAAERRPPALGIDEAALAGLPGRPAMVTKMPVRLASLARLDLARNARALGAPGIVAVMGDFLDRPLADLPAPDAVFVGGHGGRLGELLARVDPVLAPGGRVVLNAVLDPSRADFEAATARLGYRALPPLRLQVDDHNPITVLAAEKPAAPAGRVGPCVRTVSAPSAPLPEIRP